MTITKKQWMIIGVVVALIAVWYFFLRKKKSESNFMMASGSTGIGACPNPNEEPCVGDPQGRTCCPKKNLAGMVIGKSGSRVVPGKYDTALQTGKVAPAKFGRVVPGRGISGGGIQASLKCPAGYYWYTNPNGSRTCRSTGGFGGTSYEADPIKA
jgi:hypothetical protein